MDTAEDFQFLEESVALEHNPEFGEGEYLVIQVSPIWKTVIRVVHRTFNYVEAKSRCNLENLSHDDSVFNTRIYHNGKLWIPRDLSGIPYRTAPQQFWEIDPNYEAARIEIHNCSYPYFRGDLFIETCLIQDNGREITICPNCGETLRGYEDEEYDEDNDLNLSSCKGCSNYDGCHWKDNFSASGTITFL